MALYYVVKLFQSDPRTSPEYLGLRDFGHQGETKRFGTCLIQNAQHFLWQEEAVEALRQFMSEHDGARIVRGQVYHVEERPVGPVVNAGAVTKEIQVKQITTVEEFEEAFGSPPTGVVEEAAQRFLETGNGGDEIGGVLGVTRVRPVAFYGDVDVGESLYNAYMAMDHEEDRPKRIQEARLELTEWFLDNAEEIFEVLRASQQADSAPRPVPESSEPPR